MTIRSIVGEPFAIHRIASGSEREDRVADLLKTVGLDSSVMNRYPHEFSGGQRQRIGIARALALRPKLIVADEPVSALDVSIQAQIINLLADLQEQFGLTYLFISHAIPVIEHISTRIGVMYLGKLVEVGTSAQICAAPKHPYTQALLSAVPIPDPAAKKQRMILGATFRRRSIRRPVADSIPDARLLSIAAKSKSRRCGRLKMAAMQHATWCNERSECKRGSAQPLRNERSECKRDIAHDQEMKFELLTKDTNTRARRGRLHTAHGIVETPIFMPVGTQATVKSMTADQLRDLDVEILLCNSYHLFLRPGHETVVTPGWIALVSWDGIGRS